MSTINLNDFYFLVVNNRLIISYESYLKGERKSARAATVVSQEKKKHFMVISERFMYSKSHVNGSLK